MVIGLSNDSQKEHCDGSRSVTPSAMFDSYVPIAANTSCSLFTTGMRPSCNDEKSNNYEYTRDTSQHKLERSLIPQQSFIIVQKCVRTMVEQAKALKYLRRGISLGLHRMFGGSVVRRVPAVLSLSLSSYCRWSLVVGRWSWSFCSSCFLLLAMRV